MQLSISQVVDLSVNVFVDVVVDEDIPNINEAIYTEYKVFGLVKKFIIIDKVLYVRISTVDLEMKQMWMDYVRLINSYNKSKGTDLIHRRLNELSNNRQWGDIDLLIGLIDAEKDAINIIAAFLIETFSNEAEENLRTVYEFFNKVYHRLMSNREEWF